jgi:hypothetical protein
MTTHAHVPARPREFLPVECQPGWQERQLMDEQRLLSHLPGPSPIETLSNPLVIAGLMSLGTGTRVTLPAYGLAGRSITGTFIRNGLVPPTDWDLTGLCGV